MRPEDEGMEAARQRAIADYSLAEPGTEPAFDHLSALAASLFGVPTGLVTVLAGDRQLFRGACGTDLAGTPREVAFCEYTVRQEEVLVVEDATRDPRFSGNPLVTEAPNIRFYAGVPLRVDGGVAVGSLCVIDYRPRAFSVEERALLARLGRVASDLVELRAGSLAAGERGEALARQSELLSATVQNVEQGIAVFGADLSLLFWNERFFDLFGFPRSLAREGTSAETLIGIVAGRGELGEGDPHALVAATVASVRGTEVRKLEINRIDGRALDLRRSTMRDGRFILTATDISETRRMSRIKDEFISTVSHELRTPLTSILGALTLIDRGLAGELSPRAKQLIGIAASNGARLNDLINDILDIEKLGSGGAAFECEAVDLRPLLEEIVEKNRPYAATLNVALRLETSHKPVEVVADPGRLEQAVTNLVSNAAKFSPAGGEVRIALETTKERARVKVSDDGPGIPEAFRSRLFHRFAQGEPALRSARPGTGLGLAITKMIVDRHGGKIDVETEVGRGSTFCIDLPLAGAEVQGD